MKESDILYQRGNFWVCATSSAYHVMRDGVTHSKTDSAYPKTDDGLSVAIARANYLDKREATK